MHSQRFLSPLGSTFVIALTLLGFTFLAPWSQAQLVVDLTLDKKTYVAYEPIKIQVRVSNRAGRDIVLGGPAGASWLNFDVGTDDGKPILPSGVTPFAASTVLPSGKSVTRHISLGKSYPLGRPRNYRVKANVYFSGTQKFISSRTRIFYVIEANRVWEQTVGIPKGEPGGGGYRRYQLLKTRDAKRTQLYVRVSDIQTKKVLATYSLGRFIEVVNPQVTTDGKNRMHVLFLGAPHTYSHKTINYDGQTLTADIYRDEAGTPQLMESSDGSVSVKGGLPFDPSAPNPAVPGTRESLESRKSIRRLSERPEGLPYIPPVERD